MFVQAGDATARAREGTEVHAFQFSVKRIFDLCAAAILLLLSSPVWLIVALGMKVSSRGPLFFRLDVIGKDGEPFRMFKFRSMAPEAHVQFDAITKDIRSGPMAKVPDDPRTTRFGRLIRRYSIDELPQLLNVIRGEMSLVGPRPLSASKYDTRFLKGWHAIRLTVLPGMTGLWQVNGRVQDFDTCCRLDIRYIESWSLRQDMSILLRTPLAIVSNRGAG